MPLTDRDPNIVGRSSRASTFSNGTKCSHGNYATKPSDLLASAPGVMSMLKTSTELGDIGMVTSRKSALPRPPTRQSRPSSRLSTGSAQSIALRKHPGHQKHTPSSSIHGHSLTSDATVHAYTLDAPFSSMANVPMPGSRPSSRGSQSCQSKEMRSYSMTNTSQHPHILSSQRSYTSLRSQDGFPRPNSPFRYPARLRRPGYRPSSPAMSEITGGYSRLPPEYAPGPWRRGPSTAHPMVGELVRPQHRRKRSVPSMGSTISDMPHCQYLERPIALHPNLQFTSSSATTSRQTFTTAYSTEPSSSSSPPTPKDGSSLEVLLSTTVAGLENDSEVVSELTGGDLCYDREQYPSRIGLNNVQGAPTPSSLGSCINKAPADTDAKQPIDHTAEPSVESNEPATPPTPAALRDDGPETIQLPDSPLDGNSASLDYEAPSTPNKEATPTEVDNPQAHPLAKRLTRDVVLAVLRPAGEMTTLTVPIPSKTDGKADMDPESNAPKHLQTTEPTATPEKCPSLEPSTGSAESADTSLASVKDASQPFIIEVSGISAVDEPSAPRRSMEPLVSQKGTAEALPVDQEPSSASFGSSSFLINDSLPFDKCTKLSMLSRPHSDQTPLNQSSEQNAKQSSNSLGAMSISSSKDSEMNRGSFGTISRFSIARFFGIQPRKSSLRMTSTPSSPLSAKRGSTSIISGEPSALDARQNSSPSQSMSSSDMAGQPTEVHRAVSELPGQRDSVTTTHLSWPCRRSFPSGPPQEIPERVASLRRDGQDGTTTDLTLSQFKYPQTSLSDVKEEPHEDSSFANESRPPSSFRFPPRRSMSRASVDGCPRKPSMRAKMPGRLSESRGELPSLQFSGMDLISRLNEALENQHRSTMSLGGRLVEPNDSTLEAERPFESATNIREKYKSFFASLDNLDSAPAAPNVAILPSCLPYITPKPSNESRHREQWLEEINKLSIPNVAGALTQRLSELLPALRRLDIEEESTIEEECISPTIKKLHDVGGELLHPKQSSARLRPVPGRAELVVIDDALYNEMTQQDGEQGGKRPNGRCISKAQSFESYRTTLSAPVGLLTPERARCRDPSITDSGQVTQKTASDPNLRSSYLERASVRSQGTSRGERPWNNDKNYPWGDTVPLIDITIPERAHVRHTATAGPSKLRHNLSLSAGTDTRSTISLTSGFLDGTRSPVAANQHKRRKSLIGTISRKIRPHATTLATIQDVGNGPGPEIDDSMHIPSSADRERGRYPTTGLPPPIAFNVEDVRSFFSDDSEERHRAGVGTSVGNLKQRLNNLRRNAAKTRFPLAVPRESSPHLLPKPHKDGGRMVYGSDNEHASHTQVDVGQSALAPSSEDDEGAPTGYSGTVGMSRIEYRYKRVVEQLRAIWFRGGDLLRSMSILGRGNYIKRKNRGSERDWLGDTEMYSGT